MVIDFFLKLREFVDVILERRLGNFSKRMELELCLGTKDIRCPSVLSAETTPDLISLRL